MHYTVMHRSSGGSGGSATSAAFAQSAIPFVLVSSGTMGNNGALSGIAAVAAIYASAYVYLPANAISAGSAAGWYYAVFSSTTAATVYNNTYTSGAPTIPASPIGFVTTGPGAFTQVLTEVTGPLVTLPGGTMGANGCLEIASLWSYTNSANNKLMRTKIGATSFNVFTATTSLAYHNLTRILNRGSEAVQSYFYPGTSTAFSFVTAANATAAINTAVDQSITLSATLANAADTVTIENYMVKVFPRS